MLKTYRAAAILTAMLVMPLSALAADPLNDPQGILTLQIENDAFSIPSTDRYYTSGASIGYVTPTGAVPWPVAGLGHAVFGGGAQRLEIDLQQMIFTPADTQLYDPNPHDRPYAGQLAVNTTLIQDTAATRSLLQLSLGVIGPGAQGQSVQNDFHSLIGDTTNKGWAYQLNNEPAINIMAGRIWRYDLASFDGGTTLQILPQLTAQLGTTEIYGQGGAILRYGSGLDSDFGPSLIQPALNGTNAYTPTQPFVWYIFGGALGRAVAHNELVQGNDFSNSRGVPLTPMQADLEVGAAVIVYGLRISATEVLETPEFHNQAASFFFQYGAIAISSRF